MVYGGTISATRTTYRQSSLILLQKLAAKDLDNWEQRRVKRLPGEVSISVQVIFGLMFW